MSKQKLSSVQCLRAIAAMAVVAYHSAATIQIHGWKPGIVSHASAWGWAGVDIFFFISGFVMVMTTAGRDRGVAAAREFMAARIARIVPMYWILTSLMLVIVLAVPSLKTTEFTVMQTVTSYLFIPYEVKDSGSFYPVLYIGWTLTYEMFFYAVFAVSLCFAEPRSRVALTAFFVLLSILSLTRPSEYIFRFLTDPLLLEFVLGCVFAWAYRSGFRVSRRISAIIIAAGVLGFCVGTPSSDMAHRVFCAGIPAALLVSGGILGEAAGGWMGSDLLQQVGDASYSLYLLQAFTIPAFARVLTAADRHRILPGDLICLSLVFASVLVAALVYRTVERPIEIKLRAWIRAYRGARGVHDAELAKQAARVTQRDRGI
jgi:peptidoglycan/LPS O-acetylase OafA/YrhL